MSKYWSSIAPPPLSLLSLRPSIIDAVANSRAGMEVPDDPEVDPDKERSTFQPLIQTKVRDLIRTLPTEFLPVRPFADNTCCFLFGYTSPSYHAHN